jgi:predicted transcriptional regulator
MQQDQVDARLDLDPETQALLEEYARELGVTPSEYLEQAIASHWERRAAAQSSPEAGAE